MLNFLSGIFDASFMPHGHCYQWRPEVLWLHAVSDGLIAIAYFAIPILLVAFVSKRKDLEFGWMFMMFSAFIWLCGATHVMSIWTIWNGTYMFSGSVKAVTGVVSIATAAALVPLIPKALALPSPGQLRDINSLLTREVDARKSAEEDLRDLNADLERRIAERSAALEEANRQLRDEIAERTRTEDALRESEARFRQLADSMPQLVWSADPDGKVNYFNERHRELRGIEPGEGGEWIWAPVLHPDDRDATEEAWSEAVASGTMYEVEHRVQTASGEYRWYLSRGVPVLDVHGNITQWYGSATEINEQKEVERKLREREFQMRDLSRTLEKRVESRTTELSRANELLESRNKELQEFAYVASHDLKEPLRKIRTFAGLLEEEHSDHLPDDARMYLDRMRHASERMMSLINDLLSLSRASTQLTPFELVHFDEIVEDVWRDLPVDPDWELEARLDGLPPVEADEVRIRQLVQNLLSNSIKYRRNDRPLRVSVSCRILNEGEIDESVEVTFADNGIGFDPRYAERIFGAFQRLHGRNEYEGTGMGLAICRRIVDRHEGTIRADSRPGEGAVFTVMLPVKHVGRA
jgi:PAS domain S-box-containing protein